MPGDVHFQNMDSGSDCLLLNDISALTISVFVVFKDKVWLCVPCCLEDQSPKEDLA